MRNPISAVLDRLRAGRAAARDAAARRRIAAMLAKHPDASESYIAVHTGLSLTCVSNTLHAMRVSQDGEADHG